MRLLPIVLALGAAVQALPVIERDASALAISEPIPNPVTETAPISKRALPADLPDSTTELDIPAVLERNRVTTESRVDTFLQNAQLSRRSSALGLLDVLGFSTRDFFGVMDTLEVRINADINHLFRQRNIWYDQTVGQLLAGLEIEGYE